MTQEKLMNPIQVLTRFGGLAMLTLAGGYVLFKKFGPQPSDIATAAIHFRKSVSELQKGFETMIFGAGPAAEEIRKERESKRIPIE
jgi:hypothetical protein